MAQPYCWFENKDTKNARCSRWIVLGFIFTFIWVEIGVYISKQVKMLEVQKISIVHYTITIAKLGQVIIARVWILSFAAQGCFFSFRGEDFRNLGIKDLSVLRAFSPGVPTMALTALQHHFI